MNVDEKKSGDNTKSFTTKLKIVGSQAMTAKNKNQRTREITQKTFFKIS